MTSCVPDFDLLIFLAFLPPIIHSSHAYTPSSYGHKSSFEKMTGRVVLLTSELYFGGFTDYVMLCEDVFRQFSLSKGEAGLVCSSDTKRFHGVVASASSSKLGCGWTQTPALRHQHKHTQTHPVLHSFAGWVYSRCACLLASSTLRCHNRRDSHECTDTESTLC